MPAVYVLFATGSLLLLYALYAAIKAGKLRRQGRRYTRIAGLAFAGIVLASLLFLACLLCYARLLGSATAG